jgi:hypothetical protein
MQANKQNQKAKAHKKNHKFKMLSFILNMLYYLLLLLPPKN